MPISITILDSGEESFKEWKHYYKLLKNKGVYHCPEYIKVLEKHYGYPAELFVFEDDNGNFIYYPYFKRSLEKLPFSQHCGFCTRGYFDIDSSWYYGGPLIHLNGQVAEARLASLFVEAFSDYCKESKIISEFIRFDPNINNHSYFENLLPISKNRETVYVDLTQSEDSIWQNMEGRARTSIRKARKLGVSIHVAKEEKEVTKFCEIYAAEMERKRAPTHYLFGQQFFHELFRAIGNRVELIYAETDGVFLGGGIFVYELGATAHYFLMATDHAYRRYQANSLILYEAILHFKRKGMRSLDLQGGREGVFRFKKSFSKNRAIFFTSGIIHDRRVYEELVKCKERHLGADHIGFFPLYRQKNSN